MGEPMTMNRVIHAAVRRDLGRLEGALDRAEDGDSARASQLDRAYANLHRELQHHHESEDRIIYPYVATIAPAEELLKVMDEETADGGRTRGDAVGHGGVPSSASSADARSARDSVARTMKVVEEHLSHEEGEFEPLVWPHLDTKDWKAVEKQTRATSAAEGGQFFAWLQDGMTEENRTFLRSAVPPPVLLVLSPVAGRAYYRDIAPAWKESVA